MFCMLFIRRFRFKYIPLDFGGDDFTVEGFDFTKMTGSGLDVVCVDVTL